ncbi:hypothetical protein [Zavarzinia sp.]|uniref:bestrophin-like domain n=1 Tax=Zavarzinia sp. TaxID=2027920 RepID=UPI0035699AAD
MIDRVNDWLLDLPTTASVLVIVGGVVLIACAGHVAVHLLVPHGLRRSHNELMSLTFGAVSKIYAVLLAFIAVAVWDDFKHAETLVQSEADLVGNLYRGTAGLPAEAADRIRHDLFVYAEGVIADEWPALMMGGQEDAAGWQLLDRVHLALSGLHGIDPVTAIAAGEMMRNLNALYDARRGRYRAAEAGLPPILWWNVVAGAALIVLFGYLLGPERFDMHLATTAAIAASIALVLALIILLDDPFRGANRVSDAPFVRLVRTVERMEFPGGG